MKRILLIFLLTCIAAFAGYEIKWSTLDGGGGSGSDGHYRVTGTIGQADASKVAHTGGGYSLRGGFWQVFTLPAEDGPQLTLTRNADGTVTVGWPAAAAGLNLEVSGNLQGWTIVGQTLTGAGSTVVTPAPGQRRLFYRLQRP